MAESDGRHCAESATTSCESLLMTLQSRHSCSSTLVLGRRTFIAAENDSSYTTLPYKHTGTQPRSMAGIPKHLIRPVPDICLNHSG